MSENKKTAVAGAGSGEGKAKRRVSSFYKRFSDTRDLAESLVMGTQATVQAAAMQSSSEAAQGADQATEAISGLASTAGATTRQLIEATARTVGATGGGIKGAASGIAQGLSIAGDAFSTATRTAVSEFGSAADMAAQGDLDAAARQAAQGITNVSLSAAMGAIGAGATVMGAIVGGVQGAGAGAMDSSFDMTDAAAQMTKGMIRDTAKSAEVVTDVMTGIVKASSRRVKKALVRDAD
ncbi:MAG: hypothetical protein WBV59_04330 [Anaerolineae bacterium]